MAGEVKVNEGRLVDHRGVPINLALGPAAIKSGPVFKEYAGANITLTGGAGWGAVDAATLDFSLSGATVGDILEVTVNGIWSSAGAGNGFLDIATMVAGSPVSYMSSGSGTQDTNGVPSWWGVSSATSPFYGRGFLTLTAADIVAGVVSGRLLGNAATVNKVLSVGGAAGNRLKLSALLRTPG